MIRFIYNLLFPFALLLFLPRYLQKMRRRGNYRRNLGQRFGIFDSEVRARFAADRPMWIHAVSVGEVVIALKLIAKLREMDPQFRCVVTTTTPTGFAVAEKEASAWLSVLYHPLDFWPVVRRAFDTIQPHALVLVEAEVWPNLAAEAHRRGVPLALVNARLSDRSERRFRRFAALVRPTFRLLDLVCVQEQRDFARWQALGVRREAINATGSIKYDPGETTDEPPTAAAMLRALGVEETRPILIGGSTHPGEEEILARAFFDLREEVPNAFLILAPRHVERANEVALELERLGLPFVRRSSPLAKACDALLLDTTGELRHWYSVATVVFIGKSLTARGGQNPVEPILAGKPVVFGSQMQNFATLARSLVVHDAAVQIAEARELAPAILALFRDANRRAEMVSKARQVLNGHRGATARTAGLILSLCGKSLASHGGASDIGPLS